MPPRRTLALMLAAVCLSAAAVVHAAPPGLASRVPEDVGLYVELVDPPGSAAQFQEGPWPERFEAFPPWQSWARENVPKLRTLTAELARQLGVDALQLHEQLSGNNLAVAVWPPTDGGAADGPALVLIDVAESRFLATALSRLKSAHLRANPDGESRTVAHAGYEYDLLRKVGGADDAELLCTAAVGTTAILANSEPLIRRVLELSAGALRSGSLADSAAYRDAQERLPQATAAWAFVNTRAWDELLTTELQRPAPPQEARPRELLLATWKACDYAVASLELSDRLAVEAFIRLDQERLPPPVREELASQSGVSRFLDRVPGDALAAAAGRFELGRWFGEGLLEGPREERPAARLVRAMLSAVLLGTDPVHNLLADIGPDVGTYLLGPAEGDPLAIEWVFGIGIRPPFSARLQPSTAQVVEGGLKTLWTLLAAMHNAERGRQVAVVVTVARQGWTLTSLRGVEGWPIGLEPTFTLGGGYFFAGTSPGIVAKAAGVTVEDSLASSDRFRKSVGPRLPSPSHLVYFDMLALRAWSGEHRELLIDWAMRQDGRTRETAERGLEQLQALLALSDTAAVAVQIDERGIAASVGLTLEESR